MRAKILSLIIAVMVGVLAGIAAPAQAAPAQSQMQHAARPAHSCAGIGRMGSGPHMWQDEHGGANSQLARGMAALICSAGDGATIDIKSWFVTVGGAAMARIVTSLRLMHRYHRVRINVFVARSWYTSSQWHAFRSAFFFARVGSCARACMSGVTRSISHSKWITVSRLRSRNGGGSAVLSTSANPSNEQFSSGQSGIVVLRARSVYSAFIRQWNAYNRCASGRGCNHRVRAGRWYGYRDTHVWFEPSTIDPTIVALSHLDCRRGGAVDVMSLYLYRIQVIHQLTRLRRSGCTVHVLLEHSKSPSGLAMSLRPRCEFNHDKLVIISVGRVRMVIAGSQDQTPNEVLIDDNQMVKTTNRSVFRRYVAYFNHQYRSPWSGGCGGGGFVG